MNLAAEYLLLAYALTGTLSIAASQLAMGAGFVVGFFNGDLRRGFREIPRSLAIGIVAWVAASLLATVFASDPWASALKLKKLILLATVAWPVAVLRSRWHLGRAVVLLLFAAGVTSLYGVTTFLWQGGAEIGARIRGFHGFYVTNSGLLLLCTFPALAFAECREIAASYRWGAALAAAAILSSQLLGCLPATWLGTTVGLIVYCSRSRSLLSTSLLAALVAFTALGPEVFRERLEGFFDPQESTRSELGVNAESAKRLFREDFATGWGLHDLGVEVSRVREPDAPRTGHLKSVPLQLAASMGIPGLIAFSLLVWGWFATIAAARGRSTSPFSHAVVRGAEASLFAFLAAGLLEWNLGDSEILALLGFLLGMCLAVGRMESTS